MDPDNDFDYAVGKHMKSPHSYICAKGNINAGDEIVILQVDKDNSLFTIMDCNTGLVLRNTIIPAAEAA